MLRYGFVYNLGSQSLFICFVALS